MKKILSANLLMNRLQELKALLGQADLIIYSAITCLLIFDHLNLKILPRESLENLGFACLTLLPVVLTRELWNEKIFSNSLVAYVLEVVLFLAELIYQSHSAFSPTLLQQGCPSPEDHR